MYVYINFSQVSEPLKLLLEADGVMVFEKTFNTDYGIQSLGDKPLVSHVSIHAVTECLLSEVLQYFIGQMESNFCLFYGLIREESMLEVCL